MSDHNFLVSDNCAALDLWLLSVLACCFYHRTWLICFPNSKRSIWLRAGGCFHQRAWRFLYPKLQLPCLESLISSPWLQHHAFNLRSQDTDQNLNALLSGPQVRIPVSSTRRSFLSAHATVCDMRSNSSNGLGSVRRTFQAGAALMNESYCCSFLSGIQFFIDIRNRGEFESLQNLCCVFYVHCVSL